MIDNVITIRANEMATNYYATQLQQEKDARDYLIKERGLKQSTLDEFKIGYAGLSRETGGVVGLLKANNLPWQHLATLDGDRDYFQNRIIIPVRLFGSTRTFTSRAFPDRTPKHLHMRGPRTVFFNEEKLASSAYVFIVESPICAMTLHQNGVNAIAKYGTSISQSEKFDPAMRIYIVPDIEDSRRGEIDAMKTSSILFSAGLRKIKILYLPKNGHKIDINSFFLTHNMDDFQELANKAIPCTEQEDITVTDPQGKRTYSWEKEVDSHIPKEKTKYESTSRLLRDINDKVSILKVFESYVKIGKMGGYYVCQCPIHGEKDASLYIYTDKDDGHEDWYCFGCNRGGDVIEFIKLMEDVNFGSALDIIRDNMKEWSR